MQGAGAVGLERDEVRNAAVRVCQSSAHEGAPESKLLMSGRERRAERRARYDESVPEYCERV